MPQPNPQAYRPQDLRGIDTDPWLTASLAKLGELYKSASHGRPELAQHGVILSGMPQRPGMPQGPGNTEEALLKYAPNINKLIRPFRGGNRSLIPDLEQEAKMGLLKAYDLWNKSDKSIPFHAYLIPHVRSAITDFIRKQGKDISHSEKFAEAIGKVKKAESAFPYVAGEQYAKGVPIERVPPPGPLEVSLMTKLKPRRVERVMRKLYPTEKVGMAPVTGDIISGGGKILSRGGTRKEVLPEQLISKPASSISGELENFLSSLKLKPEVLSAIKAHLGGETLRDIAKTSGGSFQQADRRVKEAIEAARKAFLKMGGVPR